MISILLETEEKQWTMEKDEKGKKRKRNMEDESLSSWDRKATTERTVFESGKKEPEKRR